MLYVTDTFEWPNSLYIALMSTLLANSWLAKVCRRAWIPIWEIPDNGIGTPVIIELIDEFLDILMGDGKELHSLEIGG